MIAYPPHGSLISSILSSCRGLAMPTVEKRSFLNSFWGRCAARVSREHLNGALTAQELAIAHSAAPLWLAIQRPEAARALLAEYVDGTIENRLYLSMADAPEMSASLRRCPMCVAEDLSHVGYAFARTIHQLPLIWRCDAHDIPLEERCASCGQEFKTVRRLLHFDHQLDISRCAACGGTVGIPLKGTVSAGYRCVTALINRVLSDATTEVRPSARATTIPRALELLNESAISAFQEHWQSSTFEQACQAAAVEPRWVEPIFKNGALPYDFATVIVSTSFALEILRQHTARGNIPTHQQADKTVKKLPEFEARILNAATEFGISLKAAASLCEGVPTWQIVAEGTPNLQIRAFLESLGASEQTEMFARQKVARFRSGRPKMSERAEYEAQIPVALRARRELVSSIVRDHVPELLGPDRPGNLRLSGKVRRVIWAEHRALFQWMQYRDGAWFNGLLPSVRHREPGDLVQAREQLQQAIEAGVSSKQDLRGFNFPLYRWLSTHDSSSLTQAFGTHVRPPPRSLDEAQDRLAIALLSGARNRDSLDRIDPRIYAWCLRNAPVLLDQLFPRERSGRRKKTFSPSEARDELQMAITSGAANRWALRRANPRLYVWLSEHDPLSLSRAFGVMNRRPAPKSVAQAEQRLRVALQSGIHNRGSLHRFDYSTHMWCLQHAPELLNQLIPRRRRRV